MRLSTLILLLLVSPCFAAREQLVVHEWGTFTSLVDESGRAIGGVNVDDEPLPSFVHRLEPKNVFSKGFSESHPDVTMRLETPVIYFYPPDVEDESAPLTVTAAFKGGLLSEFYPKADVTIDGAPDAKAPSRVSVSTQSTLTWADVRLSDVAPAPVTNAHVWTAPRAVAASPISVGQEGEKYIFYRGIGHLEAPVKVIRSGDGKFITLYDNRPGEIRREFIQAMPMWLCEFRADGSCAFRVITDPPAPATAKALAQPGTFADTDSSSENVDKLKTAMKSALRDAGLFEDEADAMLETWKLSYFKSVGQRLFYLVPREWTDRVLPLEISRKCELTRVMMARTELVTPQQRLAAQKLTDPKAKLDVATATALRASLGRFANALLRDEHAKRTPSPAAAAAN